VKKYQKRLKSLQDIRRFLAQITNQLENGEIEESKARCLGYLCSIMQSIIKDSDLELRIEALERTLKLQKD